MAEEVPDSNGAAGPRKIVKQQDLTDFQYTDVYSKPATPQDQHQSLFDVRPLGLLDSFKTPPCPESYYQNPNMENAVPNYPNYDCRFQNNPETVSAAVPEKNGNIGNGGLSYTSLDYRFQNGQAMATTSSAVPEQNGNVDNLTPNYTNLDYRVQNGRTAATTSSFVAEQNGNDNVSPNYTNLDYRVQNGRPTATTSSVMAEQNGNLENVLPNYQNLEYTVQNGQGTITTSTAVGAQNGHINNVPTNLDYTFQNGQATAIVSANVPEQNTSFNTNFDYRCQNGQATNTTTIAEQNGNTQNVCPNFTSLNLRYQNGGHASPGIPSALPGRTGNMRTNYRNLDLRYPNGQSTVAGAGASDRNRQIKKGYPNYINGDYRAQNGYASAAGPSSFPEKVIKYIDNPIFVIIRANEKRNIDIAQSSNKWVFSPQTEKRILTLFGNEKTIYLVFYVKELQMFMGVAEYKYLNIGKNYTKPTATINWKYTSPLHKNKTKHLLNPYNAGKPIHDSQDGVVIQQDVGEELLRIYSEAEGVKMH